MNEEHRLAVQLDALENARLLEFAAPVAGREQPAVEPGRLGHGLWHFLNRRLKPAAAVQTRSPATICWDSPPSRLSFRREWSSPAARSFERSLLLSKRELDTAAHANGAQRGELFRALWVGSTREQFVETGQTFFRLEPLAACRCSSAATPSPWPARCHRGETSPGFPGSPHTTTRAPLSVFFNSRSDRHGSSRARRSFSSTTIIGLCSGSAQ